MGYVPKIAVVGGGVSGLVLAQELSSRGLHATVFDTGEHACGGRASTREVTDDRGRHFSFDHSTQYFTATPGSRFAAMAASWVDRGLITPWPRGRVGVLDAGAFAPFEMTSIATSASAALPPTPRRRARHWRRRRHRPPPVGRRDDPHRRRRLKTSLGARLGT